MKEGRKYGWLASLVASREKVKGVGVSGFSTWNHILVNVYIQTLRSLLLHFFKNETNHCVCHFG